MESSTYDRTLRTAIKNKLSEFTYKTEIQTISKCIDKTVGHHNTFVELILNKDVSHKNCTYIYKTRNVEINISF